MASVAVQASFQLSNGEVIDMKTTMTEGTEAELLTSTEYAVSAVSLGTFAEGKRLATILQAPSAPNMTSYAFIDRRGEILCVLPVAVAGVQWQPCPMPFGFTLQAGDTLRVMASTAASRLFSWSCITRSNVHSIFTGTPSGSGNTDLVHLKSGQGLGASLTNQSIASQWATSVDGSKIDSAGGLYVLNDRGLPQGALCATNPTKQQPKANSMGLSQIGLNFVARVTTNA
jgi:hypothetical protein